MPTPTLGQLRNILSAHALTDPADGACTQTARAVTADLLDNGFTAHTVTVAGWLQLPWLGPDQRVLGFAHTVTVCGDYALDGTARQFNPELPSVWVEHREEYLSALAAATQVDSAAFWEVDT